MNLKQRIRKALFAFFKEEIMEAVNQEHAGDGIDKSIKYRVYYVDIDGYPDVHRLGCRIAFIYNNSLIPGYPIHISTTTNIWKSCDKLGRKELFKNITEYVVFDRPVERI